jgi:nitrogen-specific signal transduction histidine kinase
VTIPDFPTKYRLNGINRNEGHLYVDLHRDGFSSLVAGEVSTSARHLRLLIKLEVGSKLSTLPPFLHHQGQWQGLGLSLARRIVEEHHGRIDVSSVVGKGSELTVLLPFHMPAAQVAGS